MVDRILRRCLRSTARAVPAAAAIPAKSTMQVTVSSRSFTKMSLADRLVSWLALHTWSEVEAAVYL